MPEEELPIKNMGAISGYFIECYCIPDESYTLNAAKILPLTETIDPGAAVDLDVSIKADTVIRLEPVPGTLSFLGNYQHMTRLANYGIDSLFLSILTPENEHITAKTAVPDAIEIASYSGFPGQTTPPPSRSKLPATPSRITIFSVCKPGKATVTTRC